MELKPILKWVGGKTQILGAVLERMPRMIQNYYEPFVGGGSVLLGILGEKAAGRIAIRGMIYVSDVNANLVNLYECVRDDPAGLIRELSVLVREYEGCRVLKGAREPGTHTEALESKESYYYWVRAAFNGLVGEARQGVRAAAMLVFLNKTCFRGLYREGPRGFNVPFGNYKTPAIYDADNIMAVSRAFTGVVFRCCDFGVTLADVGAGDFVYLDPPYVPESATSFVGYNEGGFKAADHERLFGLCRGFGANRAQFLLSNADVPLVRTAFEGYAVATIECKRSINSKNPGAMAREVLVQDV
jgi:DNA adenine methylase